MSTPFPRAPLSTLVDPYGNPLWDSATGAIPAVLKGSKVPDLAKVFQDETGMDVPIAAGSFANVSPQGGVDTSGYVALAAVTAQVSGTSPNWAVELLQQYVPGIYGPNGSPTLGSAASTSTSGGGVWARGAFAPGGGQYIQIANNSSTDSLTVTAVYHEGWAQ